MLSSSSSFHPSRSVRWLAVLLAGVFLAGVVPSFAQERPNVVVLLADDLGYGDVGCYGADLLETPNIDRLAAEGVRFTDAHTPAAVCQPTRYGLMAGRYNWRRGRPWDGTYMFADGEETLQRVLGRAGYDTAAFGKWHNGWGRGPVDYNETLKPGPLESGFDYFFGTPRSHNEPPQVFVENRRVYKLDPDDPLRIIPHEEVVERGLKDWGWGLSEGAEAAHEARPEEEIDLIVAERAADWLREKADSQPFFLYVAFVAPHVPISPAEEFQGSSDAGQYGDYVQQLDASAGIVLDALAEEGLDDDTLVIFTSDNGAVYMHSAVEAGHPQNADLLGQKTDAWLGGNQVPFIVRWPGKAPAGVESDALVSVTDIMATVAAATGTDLPPGAAPDSLNQLPVFVDPRGAEAARNEMVLTGIFGQGILADGWVYYPFQGSGGMTAHPTQRWGQPYEKLGLVNSDHHPDGTRKEDAPPAQLYHLETDPGQTTNLFREHPERAAAMDERLRELLAPPEAPVGDGSTVRIGPTAPRRSPVSWNADIWGDPASIPARLNHYVSDDRDVWLLALGPHGSFNGESLLLQDDATVWFSGSGDLGEGVLILDGGQVQVRSSGPASVTGRVRVESASRVLVVDGSLELAADLAGTGDLELATYRGSAGATVSGEGREFSGDFVLAGSGADGATLEIAFARPYPGAGLRFQPVPPERSPLLVLSGDLRFASAILPGADGGTVNLLPGVYEADDLRREGVAPDAILDQGGSLRVGGE